MEAVSPLIEFLPDIHGLRAGLGTILACMIMIAMGGLALGRNGAAELRLVAGWGILCVTLTLWGSVTAWPMAWPLAAFCGIALFGLRISKVEAANLGRIAAIAAPLWFIMLAAKPSQMDTWLNLLPNAAYLYDWQMFPAEGRPDSYSFLPAAPYNTQFASYFASMVAGELASNGLALFNLVLQVAVALMFARAIEGANLEGGRRGTVSWWACAGGLLLALPLNLAFIPRTFLSGYGEAPLAATLVFALYFGLRLMERLAEGTAIRAELTGLALTLAAMINVKQQGLGLFMAFGASLFAAALFDRRIMSRRLIACAVVAAAPGLIEYVAWHLYVAAHMPAGELTPLPLAQWHFHVLPSTLRSMFNAILKTPAYFVVVGAVFVGAVVAGRPEPRSGAAAALKITALTVLLYNGYLLVAYIGHFPEDRAASAHSYFRYMSQLSLAVTYSVFLWALPAARGRVARRLPISRPLGAALVAAVAIAPIPLARMLRFDLNPPQEEVFHYAREVAGRLEPGETLGLIMPTGRPAPVIADNEEYPRSFVRGAILYIHPRRHPVTFASETLANPATLDGMQAAAISKILVTCVPPEGLADARPGHAALLTISEGHWKTALSWNYPQHELHWSHLMDHAPFCNTPQDLARSTTVAVDGGCKTGEQSHCEARR